MVKVNKLLYFIAPLILLTITFYYIENRFLTAEVSSDKTVYYSENTSKIFQLDAINPVLKKLNLYSGTASKLLLGTAIQESLLGKLSKNVFQIELQTVSDINKNFLAYHPKLHYVIQSFYNPRHSVTWNLDNNIKYEIAIARIVYLRSSQPLPNTNNVSILAKFWKHNYNTYLGKGTSNEFVAHFENYLIKNRQIRIQRTQKIFQPYSFNLLIKKFLH